MKNKKVKTSEMILATVKKAGKKGITVNELAEKLGKSYITVYQSLVANADRFTWEGNRGRHGYRVYA
jgi:hypothetical protein